MSKTITSSSITFIDNTDNRKIEAFISSNLPTTQIYNVNTQEYSPDWTSQPLTLIPTVYLDSSDITSDAIIQWERKYGADAAESITSDKNLIISSNELSQNSGMVTYICKAEYQSMMAITQIVFTRVDTGLNGAAGADGTSVTILGIAYANTSISLNNYYTLYSDSDCTTAIDTSGLENGDSYLVNGYLCIYNTTQQQFLCTGKIQGPQGIQGESAKQIVLSANSQLFKVNKLGVLSPTTITVVGSAFNTSITSWKYSVDGGNTYNITANGVSRNGNVVTITGADMTSNSITIKASDDNRSDILTVYKISDGIDGADGQMGASAPIAFLTNEHIGFASDSNGQVPFQTVTTSVVAYNGNTKVTPTIGTISNLPTGMSINTDNIKEVNNELIIPIVIENNSTFGGNSGAISIPVLSPINSSLKLSWSKVTSGTDAITFQVYSNNGLVLSKAESSITLNTFAYDGSTAITSGATYQWYVQSEDEWVAIADATNDSLVVNKEDVLKSGAYQCQMTYKDNIYYSTVSVQDKSDEYSAFIQILSGSSYWVLYPVVYNEHIETDSLLGVVSKTEPSTPSNGDYWYDIDESAPSVTLKQYNDAAWVNSSDSQELIYDWSIVDSESNRTILPGTDKIKIITPNDFTNTITFECKISNETDGILAICSATLTDVSDPIMSETAPTNPKNGQLWLKKNENGTFLLFMYDASNDTWVASNADEKQSIYTSKPSSYKVGDLWITEADNVHGSYLKGTLLQALVTSSSYSDGDWASTLKYDQDLSSVKNTLDQYKEIMQVNNDGIRMGAVGTDGQRSNFSALFSSTELCFYEGTEKILRLINNKLIAPRIEAGDITVSGTLSIGAFQWVKENNGSLSLIVNS